MTFNNEKEVLEYITIEQEQRKSQAKKIGNIFLKYKKWIGTQHDVVEFDQPVLFLERRSGDVEFYEKATTGRFEFTHSSGEFRFLILNPFKLKRFKFGAKSFKGYWCHEDIPVPLPQDPIVLTEEVNNIVAKATETMDKYKAGLTRAKTDLIWKIAIGIAIIIGVIFFGMSMIGQQTPVDVIAQTAKPIAQNITPSILP